MKLLVISLLACSAFATTSILQNSGCGNNTNQLTAVLSSNVTAGHTLDFNIGSVRSSAGVVGTITVTDNDPGGSNTYILLGGISGANGSGEFKGQTFSAIATHTLSAPLTITATTTGVISTSGTCAIEWSDKFKLTLEVAATSISFASSATNVGCTSTGTAPNTTVTPAVTGDIVVIISEGSTAGAGRLQHTKSGTDITNAMVGGAGGNGDNIGGGNNAGWGLDYIINTTASTAYTAGYTLVPSANGAGGKCSTMIRQLDTGSTSYKLVIE